MTNTNSFRFFFVLSVSLISISCNIEKPIKGAVVSAREEASKIGVEIMAQGGNAFDAMIATDLALTVCYPNAGNIAGNGKFRLSGKGSYGCQCRYVFG